MNREGAIQFVDALEALIIHVVNDHEREDYDATAQKEVLIGVISPPRVGMDPAETKAAPADQSSRVKPCKYCDQTIAWLRTPKITDNNGQPAGNKPMPIQVDTYRDGDEIFDRHRHTPHFGNCSGYKGRS